MDSIDQHFMQQAITLAKKGQFSARPNPCVGAVVIKDGHIISEGYHLKAGTDHAERIALDRAGHRAKGATLYVTLEPCAHTGKTPPCVDKIIASQIARVVMASHDPNPLVNGQGMQKLIGAGIEVKQGCLQAEADNINQGFLSTHTRKRPFVRLKMAMSVDAKTAMADGQSQWITGATSREDVQRLRAKSGAIITGIGTILHDNPSLTVRSDEWQEQPTHPIPSPLRVIVDSTLRLSANAKIFQCPGPVWVVCALDPSKGEAKKIKALETAGARIIYFTTKQGKVDIQALMTRLTEHNIHDVLVESGQHLAGSFMQANLVDELWCYIAPKVLGSNTQELFHLPSIKQLAEHVSLTLKDIQRFGEDVRLVYGFSEE